MLLGGPCSWRGGSRCRRASEPGPTGVYTHHTFQVTQEPGAAPEPIRTVTRRLLGLDETQADALFDANNTRDYVLGSLADYIDMGEAQERAAARSLVLGGC